MATIAKINGIAIANIAKINGIAKASISKYNGIDMPATSGGGELTYWETGLSKASVDSWSTSGAISKWRKGLPRARNNS